MKKLSVSLIVMLLATVACANEVDILLKDEGSGVLGVYYDVNDACSTSVPVAYSLTIVTTDGVMVEPCDVIYKDPCYPVYIDYAHDAVGENFDPASWDPCDPCYTIGEGNPMANPNAAGVPGAEASSFSICMGRLDENQVAGPTVETCLVKIQLADGGAGSTDVTVAPDTLRGGVVGSTFAVTSVYEDGAFTQVNFAAPDCYIGPDYAEWVAVGKPDCWCNAQQCHGDADGAIETFGRANTPTWVGDNDIAVLALSYRSAVGSEDICADFDHATETYGRANTPTRVGDNDISVLAAWYRGTAVPGDCNTASPVTP